MKTTSQPLHAEHALSIGEPGCYLHAIQYVPLDAPRKHCIFLNPLDNECNNATRFYVQTARLLAQRGVLVIRFDYRGTGNSMGCFSDVSLATLLEDIALVRSYLVQNYEPAEMCLVGARFGGTLALLASRVEDGIDELVLWDPILDMTRDFQVNFVNKTLLNRRLMGMGASGDETQTTGTNGIVEYNCLPFSRAFVDELQELSVEKLIAPKIKRGLAIIPRAAMSRHAKETVSALQRETALTFEFLDTDRRHVRWEAEDFSARSALVPALQKPVCAFLSP